MSSSELTLSGSGMRLLETFKAHGVPCAIVDGQLNIMKYQTKNGEWRLLKGMMSEKLPLFSKLICHDKWWTYKLLNELGLPTPKTLFYKDTQTGQKFLQDQHKIVVKPRDGAHGFGVRLNVGTDAELTEALEEARRISKNVLLQQQLEGTDFRVLVIGGKVISAVERQPATVIGDGKHSVMELIALENDNNPLRGELGIDTLVKISITAVKQYLTAAQLCAIPDKDVAVRVIGPSNQSLGGTVREVLPNLSPALLQDTIRLITHLKMPIAGVDCIVTPSGYSFLEINASPGIVIHEDPSQGITSGCFETYMRLLHEDK